MGSCSLQEEAEGKRKWSSRRGRKKENLCCGSHYGEALSEARILALFVEYSPSGRSSLIVVEDNDRNHDVYITEFRDTLLSEEYSEHREI